MRGTVTETSVNVTGLAVSTINATSHTPLALEIKITVECDANCEWAGLVIETKTPRPVVAALTN